MTEKIQPLVDRLRAQINAQWGLQNPRNGEYALISGSIREWDDEESALLWRSTLSSGNPVKRYKAVKFFSQQELLMQEAANEIERLTAAL